jgi:hypothetical protein
MLVSNHAILQKYSIYGLSLIVLIWIKQLKPNVLFVWRTAQFPNFFSSVLAHKKVIYWYTKVQNHDSGIKHDCLAPGSLLLTYFVDCMKTSLPPRHNTRTVGIAGGSLRMLNLQLLILLRCLPYFQYIFKHSFSELFYLPSLANGDQVLGQRVLFSFSNEKKYHYFLWVLPVHHHVPEN